MIWHLIAAAFAGLGAAGIGLLLRWLSRQRLPRWIVPVFAGLGMLGYQIYHEYTWFEHKRAQLPASTQVVSTEQTPAFWRPWTFLVPLTSGFTVVDQENLVRSQNDDQQLVEFILYRFEMANADRVQHRAYLLNCSARDLVPMTGEPRRPDTEQLRRLERQDPLLRTVCGNA